MVNIERNTLFYSSIPIIISIIISITSIIVIEIGLNYYHHVALAQQLKNKSSVMGGVHLPELEFEENHTNIENAIQKRVSHAVIAAGMIENRTITTIKLNATKFQQIDKSQFAKAPEFAQISGYINTPNNSRITLSSLKGKVVLVYIWTYTCINSIRPMPYIDDWNQKYSHNGLVVVGVHSPEFQFEENYTNVKDAVQRFGITYPVVLDSEHGTWNAYRNNYWPRYYLIDSEGYVRYDHIGEGDYDQIEKSIQALLAERAALMGAKIIIFDATPMALIEPGSLYYVDLRQKTTPEIYTGYKTARAPLGNPEGFRPNQTVSYFIPSTTNFKPDTLYLQGEWKNNPDNMELQGDNGRIVLVYHGKSVNIIAGGNGGGVVLDDKDKESTAIVAQSNNSLGEDLSSASSFKIDGQRLYNLSIHNKYTGHTIIIDVKGKGFQFYTFTFG